MNRLLRLQFKGTREYLHGTDFFNVLTDIAEEITSESDSYVERLVLRKYAKRECEITNLEPRKIENIVGQVRYSISNNKETLKCWLVETDKEITDRYIFDEDIIMEGVKLYKDRKSVVLEKHSVYTPFDDVIVLTKYLNNSISPTSTGRWLFGQLDLIKPLTNNYQSLEIRMKNLIEGKFSVNDILLDDVRVGAVRFIVGAT